MKRIVYVTPLLALFILGASFTTKVLDEIVIDDFEKPGIWSWWKSAAYPSIEHDEENSVLKVTVEGAGNKDIDNGYNTFGRDLAADPIDFTETNVVYVRMKHDADADVKIRLDLKDIDDRVTNANAVTKTLKAGDEWQDLYFVFDTEKHFKQSWPSSDEVDPEEVKEFLFFVNPGNHSNLWSGTISIDKVAAMSAEDME